MCSTLSSQKHERCRNHWNLRLYLLIRLLYPMESGRSRVCDLTVQVTVSGRGRKQVLSTGGWLVTLHGPAGFRLYAERSRRFPDFQISHTHTHTHTTHTQWREWLCKQKNGWFTHYLDLQMVYVITDHANKHLSPVHSTCQAYSC